MPYPTPAYPFDAASAEAFRSAASRRTPHAPLPVVAPPPVVLGGVLRSGSPFLDALPMDMAAMDAVPLDAPAPADGLLVFPLRPAGPEPLDAVVTEPPPPATPFDRAAVARARARASRAVERVEATVMSDDGVVEHVCDVTAWLAGATVREVDALARAGWVGDEAAEVAGALADDDPEVADVLRHARRSDAGVVVEIDGRAAMAWLARHRPAVADALDETPDAPDDAGENAG